MINVAQINICDSGSTGKIMLGIAEISNSNGVNNETYSLSPRHFKDKKAVKGNHYFGSFYEYAGDYITSKYTGYFGYGSVIGTLSLLMKLKSQRVDLIHIHNLHNSYLNYHMLFRFIKKNRIPVVWTLHDCWSFTGKCPHFEYERCFKWKKGCDHCPVLNEYPETKIDHTAFSWNDKRKTFCNVENLTIVTPSEWLAGYVRSSFLQNYPVCVINNGIDLSVFKPTLSCFRDEHGIGNCFVLLGVASEWTNKKGIDLFFRLAHDLDDTYKIVLVGTNPNIGSIIPSSIISIHRTNNPFELAAIYSSADLFVNPTREDTFPTVNIEALACGTPVLTFKTGGSAEIIDEYCGQSVICDDYEALKGKIEEIKNNRTYNPQDCIKRAKKYDKNDKFIEYNKLYMQVLNRE